MQVRYDEGIASHIGPEPCADFREDVGEASVGDSIGQPLSRESEIEPGADAVLIAEGETDGRVTASARPARRGLRPRHVQRFIVALLSGACLMELCGKAFQFDQIKRLELELHAEYEKEIRLLDVKVLDLILMSVAAYEDQTANELAAMKDDIINPLIKEQFQLLHLMSEQIINECLDIGDIKARIQAFDVKKREIAATISP